VLPICTGIFVPWIAFSLIHAMLSFYVHEVSPPLCYAVQAIVCSILGLLTILALLRMLKRWKSKSESDWFLFLCSTTLLAVVIAMVFGNREFAASGQLFHDVKQLNTYTDVDVSLARGQEMMDAGEVNFAPGTQLDLNKSMGFHNVETYCVAPITSSRAADYQLEAYDFWAVGMNCCSSGKADFKCGEYNNPKARAGLRLMKDDQREFFRLAVQKAQSTYQIKAVHPLFFVWVKDAESAVEEYHEIALQGFMIGTILYFFFQMVMVACTAICFAKPNLFWY